MRDGICPKCGSEEVYSGANVPKMHRGLNTVPIKGTLYVTLAPLDNFVCVTCGYVESYIADERHLADIARNWPKVRT